MNPQDIALFISRVYNFAAWTASINDFPTTNFCNPRADIPNFWRQASLKIINFCFLLSISRTHRSMESTAERSATVWIVKDSREKLWSYPLEKKVLLCNSQYIYLCQHHVLVNLGFPLLMKNDPLFVSIVLKACPPHNPVL